MQNKNAIPPEISQRINALLDQFEEHVHTNYKRDVSRRTEIQDALGQEAPHHFVSLALPRLVRDPQLLNKRMQNSTHLCEMIWQRLHGDEFWWYPYPGDPGYIELDPEAMREAVLEAWNQLEYPSSYYHQLRWACESMSYPWLLDECIQIALSKGISKHATRRKEAIAKLAKHRSAYPAAQEALEERKRLDGGKKYSWTQYLKS